MPADWLIVGTGACVGRSGRDMLCCFGGAEVCASCGMVIMVSVESPASTCSCLRNDGQVMFHCLGTVGIACASAYVVSRPVATLIDVPVSACAWMGRGGWDMLHCLGRMECVCASSGITA